MPDTGAIGGAASGAAQGAAIGSVVPGIGTAVGAVVGGVVGAIGGLFSSKSGRYRKKADKLREQSALIQNFLERRALIQSYQIQRASVIAAGAASGAGLESSGVQGSYNSARSEATALLARNAEQVRLGVQANRFDRKASKYAGYSDMVGDLLGAGAMAANAGMFGNPALGGYSASAQRAGTGSFTPAVPSRTLSAPPLGESMNTSPFTR